MDTQEWEAKAQRLIDEAGEGVSLETYAARLEAMASIFEMSAEAAQGDLKRAGKE